MPRGKKKSEDTQSEVYYLFASDEFGADKRIKGTLAELKETLLDTDEYKNKFGGSTVTLVPMGIEYKIGEPNRAYKAAQDLLKQGWSKEEVCKLLSIKDLPEASTKEEAPKEIPADWLDENRLTVLRGYVKMLLPDEDVSKWNKDACRATINKMLTKEVIAEVAETPWEEDKAAEQEIKEEAKAQEEQPMAFVPPPLPPGMPVQASPLAPPPMVPQPTTIQPPIAPPPAKNNWAPPPIPSPFRSKE